MLGGGERGEPHVGDLGVGDRLTGVRVDDRARPAGPTATPPSAAPTHALAPGHTMGFALGQRIPGRNRATRSGLT
jgi:hypothetical protein